MRALLWHRTLRDDWQLHLKQARDELGLGGVRYHVSVRRGLHVRSAHSSLACTLAAFHSWSVCAPTTQGIFDDDMGVVTAPRQYNWTLIDQSWDYQVALGLTPVVELSFMPVRPPAAPPLYDLATPECD